MLSDGLLLMGKLASLEKVPSTGIFRKETAMSHNFLFFFTALFSGAFAEQCSTNRKTNQPTQPTKNDIMVLMALELLYSFSPVR